MDKEFDFVFVYEVKNRELENALLLKYELNRRGYSVALVETWESIFKRRQPPKAKVLISYALYRNGTISYVSSFVRGCKKIVNLQWEQIYTNGDVKKILSDDDFFYGIRENAVNGAHVAWGKNNYERLTKVFNVPPSRVCMGGNISLDFLRPEMKGYFYSREEIAKKFNLDNNKRIYLFISSFSYVDLPDNYINSKLFQSSGFDVNDFSRIACESQRLVLEWFEKELIKHKDIEVIYRPHPAEYGNERLRIIEEKYENFHVISDMSIKQWIVIADKIYTWWSTSISEVYAAGKGCSVLRPIDIPYDSEIEIYKECKIIGDFERFDEEYTREADFPISSENMRSYYYIDSEEASYIKVADFLEKVYKYDEFYMEVPESRKESKLALFKSNVKSTIKKKIYTNGCICKMIVQILAMVNDDRKKTFEKKLEEMQYAYKMARVNQYSERDVMVITERLSKVLNNNE